MDKHKLQHLLQSVASGEVAPSAAYERIKDLPYQELGFATLDSHRGVRQGLPEVVFCPGKTPQQISQIMRRLFAHHDLVLATRAEPHVAEKVGDDLPEVQYFEQSRMLVLGTLPDADESMPSVNVISAGTADVPVAEEAAMVLQAAGVGVMRTYDVGVAGIHRLLDRLPELRLNAASIVVAGMDGVLPSVVAGLLPGPVIAVPTSIGYGANFQGIAPLLTMLNSCAAGLTVVNIDNGFGAGVAAFRILSLLKQRTLPEQAHRTV
jgi:NCAIR mutase (PurE)-related protein